MLIIFNCTNVVFLSRKTLAPPRVANVTLFYQLLAVMKAASPFQQLDSLNI